MFGMGLPHGCRSVAKAPLSPSDSSPTSWGSEANSPFPNLLGKVPKGDGGLL